MVNERNGQTCYRPSPYDKESNLLDQDRKSYTSVALQFQLANCQIQFAKYDFNMYSEFTHFTEHLSQYQRKQFQAPISKGQLIAKISLQAALDATDIVSRTLALAIRSTSWLQSSSLPREVQNEL